MNQGRRYWRYTFMVGALIALACAGRVEDIAPPTGNDGSRATAIGGSTSGIGVSFAGKESSGGTGARGGAEGRPSGGYSGSIEIGVGYAGVPSSSYAGAVEVGGAGDCPQACEAASTTMADLPVPYAVAMKSAFTVCRNDECLAMTADSDHFTAQFDDGALEVHVYPVTIAVAFLKNPAELDWQQTRAPAPERAGDKFRFLVQPPGADLESSFFHGTMAFDHTTYCGVDCTYGVVYGDLPQGGEGGAGGSFE